MKVFMLPLLSLALVACGSSDKKSVSTGYLTDISGVTYTTKTQSGTTGALGQFDYKNGETVTFSLGDLVLGEAVAAKAEMTVSDLVPSATLYTTRPQISSMLSGEDTSSEYIAFFKFSNILWLLQSLDDDAEPDNGINISNGVTDLLMDTEISLEEDEYSIFKSKLASLASEAKDAGLVNTDIIEPFGSALDTFYSTQGISHELVALGVVKFDEDADSDVNAISTYTYDANGNNLTKSDDTNADGSAESIETSTYDLNGNLLTKSNDTNADGNAESVVTYTYGADGNVLTENLENVVGSSGYEYTFTYNSDGALKEQSFDYDADGDIDRVNTFTYNADGNYLTYTIDNNGNHNTVWTYDYDTNGNLVERSRDINSDENTDRKYTYTYDVSGNLDTYTYYKYNTSPTSTHEHTYDTNNNLLERSTSGVTETFTYDVNGNQLTKVYDDNVNDNKDYTYTYTYDENNNRLTYSIDVGSNGTVDSIEAYEYIGSTWVAILRKLL